MKKEHRSKLLILCCMMLIFIVLDFKMQAIQKAQADDSHTDCVHIANLTLYDGNTVDLSTIGDGSSGTASLDMASKTLTLTDINLKSMNLSTYCAFDIDCSSDMTISLYGNNVVTIPDSEIHADSYHQEMISAFRCMHDISLKFLLNNYRDKLTINMGSYDDVNVISSAIYCSSFRQDYGSIKINSAACSYQEGASESYGIKVTRRLDGYNGTLDITSGNLANGTSIGIQVGTTFNTGSSTNIDCGNVISGTSIGIQCDSLENSNYDYVDVNPGTVENGTSIAIDCGTYLENSGYITAISGNSSISSIGIRANERIMNTNHLKSTSGNSSESYGIKLEGQKSKIVNCGSIQAKAGNGTTISQAITVYTNETDSTQNGKVFLYDAGAKLIAESTSSVPGIARSMNVVPSIVRPRDYMYIAKTPGEDLTPGDLTEADMSSKYISIDVHKMDWLSEHADTSWYDNSTNTYIINTPEQLAGLEKLIDQGHDFENQIIILGQDIDLGGTNYNENGLYWTPFCLDPYGFKGTFDGNHKTIKNMKVYEINKSDVGLFGGLRNATVRNLTVQGTIEVMLEGTTSSKLNTTAGGIVGRIHSSNIDGCTSNCMIRCKASDISSEIRIAGIAGYVEDDSVIHDCVNYGEISSELYHPTRSWMTNESIAGGIVCYISSRSRVEGCVNYGNISAKSSNEDPYMDKYAAGIASYVNSGLIYNCVNHGQVMIDSPEKAFCRAGGIAAEVSTYSYHGQDGSIYNCFNRGAVSSNRGIYSTVSVSYGVDTAIDNCYTIGIGESNGYQVKAIDGTDSSLLMTSSELANSLDSLNAWVDDQNSKPENIAKGISFRHWVKTEGENDGYPVLVPEPQTIYTIDVNLSTPVKNSSLSTNAVCDTPGIDQTKTKISYYKVKDGNEELVTGTAEPNTVYKVKCIVYPEAGCPVDPNLNFILNGQLVTPQVQDDGYMISYSFPVTESDSSSVPSGGGSVPSGGGSVPSGGGSVPSGGGSVPSGSTPTPTPTPVTPTPGLDGETGTASSKDNSSKFVPLLFRQTKATKNSLTLAWSKIKDADGYFLYGAPCGTTKKMTRIQSFDKNTDITTTVKSLKAGVPYKYMICAYKMVNNKKVIINKSAVVRAFTAGNKTYTNPFKVAVKTQNMKITVGSTVNVTANIKLSNSKKLPGYLKKISYESGNEEIAKVTSDGKITAVGIGKCIIYVYAGNGRYTKVNVSVISQ